MQNRKRGFPVAGSVFQGEGRRQFLGPRASRPQRWLGAGCIFKLNCAVPEVAGGTPAVPVKSHFPNFITSCANNIAFHRLGPYNFANLVHS